MTALSLRKGQLRSASRAARAVVQAAGGSSSTRAWRSRHKRAATSSVERPTSRSRVSGGMHSMLKRGTPCSANSPVAALGAVQAVIVHRGAQVLARAGVQRHEPQLRSSGGKVDGRRAGAVGDAHDERLAAAVLEELLDRVGDRRRLPQPAEVPLELPEAADGEHLVDRPLESAADEGGDSGGHALDGVTVAAFLYEFYAGRLANGHSGLSWHLPARL